MKKTISIIKIHSFVSEITNSSTELFVCNTEQTIETVKEILKKIVDGYNMMVDGSYSMDMFGEPYVFNVEEYRKWKKEDEENKEWFKANNDWSKRSCDNKYDDVDGWFYDDKSESDLKYLRKNYIEYGDNSGGFWSQDRHPYYNRLNNASITDGKYDHRKRSEEVEKIYEEVSKKKTKPYWWAKPWMYHHNSTLIKQLDGCVIIVGSGDNSIPYEIWEIINSQLSGSNYHLG